MADWRQQALDRGIDVNNPTALQAAGIFPSGAPGSTTPGGTSNYGTPGGGFASVLSGQKGQEDTFNKSYSDAVNSQPSVSKLAEGFGNEVGLPQLQKSAQDLTNTLANMPTTQTNATRGFDVNEAQLQKIIASETNKLAPTVQNVVSGAQNAQNLVNTKLGYAMQDQQNKLAPYQMQGKLMSDRFAREMTGYSNDAQNELTQLLQKQQQGFQLGEDDKNRLNNLAMQEAGFVNQSNQAAKSFANSKDMSAFNTDQNIRQYNATTGRPGNTGFGPTTKAMLNGILNTKNVQGAKTGAPTPSVPSYAKPVARTPAAPQNTNILSQLGGWFKNLF